MAAAVNSAGRVRSRRKSLSESRSGWAALNRQSAQTPKVGGDSSITDFSFLSFSRPEWILFS